MSDVRTQQARERAAAMRSILRQAAYADAEDLYEWEIGACDDIDYLADRVAALETALREAIQVIEWCGQNDKTPHYTYDPKLCSTRNPAGDLPRKGSAFNTPREFARYWPNVLRAALAGGGGQTETPA